MASGDTLLEFGPLDVLRPATLYPLLDVRNGHPILKYDGAADWTGYFKGKLPRHYAGGGITVYLHVTFTSATSGTSRWEVAFEADAAQDIDSDGFAATQSAAGVPNGTSGIETIVAVTFTDGAQMDSVAAGGLFRMSVRRDADGTTGTDDVTTVAELGFIEIKET